eukprot:gene17670-biopygen5995
MVCDLADRFPSIGKHAASMRQACGKACGKHAASMRQAVMGRRIMKTSRVAPQGGGGATVAGALPPPGEKGAGYDSRSHKGQGDAQQGSITNATLAHLATPLDGLSEAQKRSLEILKTAKGRSPSKSSKQDPQMTEEWQLKLS